MRVKHTLLEKQQRQQRRQQQSCINTSYDKVQLQKRKGSFERTEFGPWFLHDMSGEDITRDSHLQVCLLRHCDRCHSEEARATCSDVILPVLRMGRVYKIQKLSGKRIHVWGLVASPLPQKLQICKLIDIRAIRRPWAHYSTKNDELRKDSLQENNSSTAWIEHEISTLLQKDGLGAREKKRKKLYGGVHTRTERRQIFPPQWMVYNLSRQRCQWSRSNYRYKEIEEGE